MKKIGAGIYQLEGHGGLAAYAEDMVEAKRSVFAVARLQVQTRALGHGAPRIGNAQRQVEAIVRRLALNIAAQKVGV